MGRPTRHGQKWRIRWTDEHGKRHSETYGEYSAAELMLERRLLEVREVKEGWRTGQRPNRSFDQLCDYWLDMKVPTKRSGDHDKSIISAHLRPTFAYLPIKRIGFEHIEGFKPSARPKP